MVTCNKIDDIDNAKAIEFHKKNLGNFKSKFFEILSKTIECLPEEQAGIELEAEVLRVKYNEKLMKYISK
jgi:tRNA(Met) C34 N-acetyltransferase TmcA